MNRPHVGNPALAPHVPTQHNAWFSLTAILHTIKTSLPCQSSPSSIITVWYHGGFYVTTLYDTSNQNVLSNQSKHSMMLEWCRNGKETAVGLNKWDVTQPSCIVWRNFHNFASFCRVGQKDLPFHACLSFHVHSALLSTMHCKCSTMEDLCCVCHATTVTVPSR